MGKIIEIKNEALSVSIKTLGAELSSVKGKSGEELLWQGDKSVWSGQAPVLFPICGGLRDGKYTYKEKEYSLEKHGFARRSEFEGEKLSEAKAIFTLKSNEETLKVYPFEFVLTVTYELAGNTIKVTYGVKNPAEDEMYFSIGAHEAYSCPEGIEDYYIEFDEEQTFDTWTLEGVLMSNKTEKAAESGKTISLNAGMFENDALIFKNVPYDKASLVHKSSKKRITVSFSGFKNFLLWTIPGAKYICLEPWAGFPDSISSTGNISEKEDIICLAGKSEYTLTHTVTFED